MTTDRVIERADKADMDPRDQFDMAVGAIGRFSLLMQLRDKVEIAAAVGKPRCGNCFWWMKSRDCPRERNVNGQTTGPANNAPVCEKFKRTQSSIELQAKRTTEAVEFAQRHGLSAPNKI